MASTHVIILGGGFAGVACAHRLAGRHDIRVTLFDRTGRQEFTPLLYQVATAELAPSDVSFDLAGRFHRHHNVEVRTAEVVAADPRAHRVTLAGGESVTGDVLVLAAGSQPNFFHTTGADRFAYPLYSLDGAERIRGRAQQLLRDAGAEPDRSDGGAVRFVVVGGGPTGVETAGALADLLDDVVPHLNRQLAGVATEVILIDHGQELLAAFSKESRERAAARLRERGVHLRFGTSAQEVTTDRVVLSDGSTVATQLAVWAGGEAAAPVVSAAGLPTGHGGRVDVLADLTVEGYPGVYAVGDAANVPSGTGEPLPQLGSVALQSGDRAAHNILAEHEGKPREPFHYHDKGIMAMLDRQHAVAELGARRHEVHGRLAFAAWLAVHAELLDNVRAEASALASWADEFYLRPHHRAPALLEAATVDAPRLRSTALGGVT